MSAAHDRHPAQADLLLVLNCGSSSIKFAVFDGGLRPLPRTPVWNGKVQGIGGAAPTYGETGTAAVAVTLDAARPYHAALQIIRDGVQARRGARRLGAIVHRVVHGGARHADPVRVDANVLAELKDCIPLAPLHQPHALDAIETLLATEPGLPQIACFDTSFHRTLPMVEQILPLPYAMWQRGLRRYGFHGLSYAYQAVALAERHGDAARRRTIVAHLGSGASLCAMRNLESVATTMGFSALDGLMMGTRSGAIDPGVLLHLLQAERLSPDKLSHLLYHESGLLGVSGLSPEPRVLLRHEHDPGETGERARLALALYVRRIARETGALAAALGGLDMLVFTAGVGEHSAAIRARVCADLDWLGVAIDAEANERHAALISRGDSRVRVCVEPANEEWIAATQALPLLA